MKPGFLSYILRRRIAAAKSAFPSLCDHDVMGKLHRECPRCFQKLSAADVLDITAFSAAGTLDQPIRNLGRKFHSNTQANHEQQRGTFRIIGSEIIQDKFGKNAVLKGMNFSEGATARERNGQIGGHKA